MELQFQWRKKMLQLMGISLFLFCFVLLLLQNSIALVILFFQSPENLKPFFIPRLIPSPELLKPSTSFHTTYFHELCLWSLWSLVLPSPLIFSLSSMKVLHCLPLFLRGKCQFSMALLVQSFTIFSAPCRLFCLLILSSEIVPVQVINVFIFMV